MFQTVSELSFTIPKILYRSASEAPGALSPKWNVWASCDDVGGLCPVYIYIIGVVKAKNYIEHIGKRKKHVFDTFTYICRSFLYKP